MRQTDKARTGEDFSVRVERNNENKPTLFQGKKVGLALSGGGAKGAFQAGVLSRLSLHHAHYNWISGISVGALNGSMLATGQLNELTMLWQTITRDDVLKKRSIPKLGFGYLKYKMGISKPPQAMFSNEPMKHLLHQKLALRDFEIPFICGTVDVANGEYTTYKYFKGDVWKISRPQSDATHQMKISTGAPDRSVLPIVASTAVPVYYDPVLIGDRWHVDGGLRNINPIKDLIQYDPDVIVVIPTEKVDGTPKAIGQQYDILESMERTLDILLNEIFLNDISMCRTINDLVLHADRKGITLENRSGRELKYYELVILDPAESLGSGTDFSRDTLDWRYRHGIHQAQQYLKHVGMA